MKKQIKKLSPHQNGKVFGILMAIATLPIFIPMFLMMMVVAPTVDSTGNSMALPSYLMIVFPILYLIFGYLSVAIMCLVYNFMQKYIGGFEYETNDEPLHSE